MKRYSIWLILCISVGILSFILPPQLMKWADEQTVDQSYVQKSEEIALVPQVSLSLTEKIALFQRKTANTLWVSKGKNYDQESVQPKIREELQKLCDLGVLEIDVSEIDFYAIEGGFVVDTEDSTQTMNIWTIYAYQKEKLYELLFVLDDETGKIIQLQQSYELPEYDKVSDGEKIDVIVSNIAEADSETTSTEMERIGIAWAEYLELPLVETYMERNLLCAVGDEECLVVYFIKKDVGNVILSINIAM